jgi:hypothetical protein
MTVKDDRSTWTEEYDKPAKDIAEARIVAEQMIENFNRYLRPYELPRTLVDVSVGGNAVLAHEWQKMNLVTQVKGASSFDIMRCAQCGITGRRFGIGEDVKPDGQYRAKAFKSCDTAQALLARRRQ